MSRRYIYIFSPGGFVVSAAQKNEDVTRKKISVAAAAIERTNDESKGVNEDIYLDIAAVLLVVNGGFKYDNAVGHH